MKVTREIIRKLEDIFEAHLMRMRKQHTHEIERDPFHNSHVNFQEQYSNWLASNHIEVIAEDEIYMVNQFFDKEKHFLIKGGLRNTKSPIYLVPIELAEKALILGELP